MRAHDFLTESKTDTDTLGGFTVQPLTHLKTNIDEEFGDLDAPGTTLSKKDMQDYADRIKKGEKSKTDKFKFGYLHSSNIKAIAKSDTTDAKGNYIDLWDLDDLAAQITTQPTSLLGTNAKMKKSTSRGDIIYDLTLPALHGIVVDERTGDFVNVNTCPNAGACQVSCYALKGGYVMFPAASMSSTRALNFLLNHSDKFMQMVSSEISKTKLLAEKNNYQLHVRWHDAGDFFSKKYLHKAYEVATAHPDVQFYAYTKYAGAVNDPNQPENWEIQFSQGAEKSQEKEISGLRKKGIIVKDSIIVPKTMFNDLVATKMGAKGKEVKMKDKDGKTVWGKYDPNTESVVGTDKAIKELKKRIQQAYPMETEGGIKEIRPLDTIITYDEMLDIPKGTERKWSVIVPPAGAGDLAATRKDVLTSFLLFH